MKYHVVIAALFLLSSFAIADSQKHALHAHSHGSAKLSIALESANHLEIEMEVSGADTVGFEHKPKTDSEKQKIATFKADLQKNLLSLLGLEETCKLLELKIDIEYENENHSDWDVDAKIHCEKPLNGHKVKMNFAKLFKGLKELNISYISETKQTSHKFKKGQGELSFE